MHSNVLRLALAQSLLLVSSIGFSAETPLRIMAANITSGNNQSYDAGHGTRIFQGLDPDVVLIQEFNFGDNSPSVIRGWIDSAFGTSFQYYREGGALIPNGIVSRYPIIASGEWDDASVSNRDFAWARIDIPGTKDLWAISVHLLTASSTVRNTEATALKNFINTNVPASDYLVIGGDFNTDSRTEAALSTLSSVVVTAAPYPVDQNNDGDTNASRAKPYDWVLVDNDLHQCRVATLIGTQSFAGGLVFDSRVFTPLTAVAPVQSGDSGSTNMQHMAVVRDFAVPDTGGPTPPSTELTFGSAVTATVTTGNWMHYTLNVPADSVTVALTMTGSSGDADLYVRKAGQPTSGTYDFRPYVNGSNETVTITDSTTPALSSGTWYVSVNGYSTATFTLTPTRTTGTTTPQTLLDTSDTVNTGAWKNYTISVPAGKTKMTVTLAGSTGDADLYIKKTAQPTTNSYDFRPYLDGSDESVVVNASTTPALSSGTWYVSVNGYATATVTLKVVVE